MAFKIKKGVISNKSWGSIDKSVIWQRLKAGLQDGADGAWEAVREMYAAVRADINADLTEADVFGPHHEIQQDGSIVLNRGGVLAAVQALRGARAEPNLTPEQIQQAEAHLKRHYTELDLTWPEGEIILLQAALTGEIAVEDVPLAPGVDLAALKAGDPEPLEIIVEIAPGKSTRGWNYLPSTVQKIVQQVATKTVAGFLGHQKPENVEFEFPTPVTHWVGATYKDGKAYIRGVADKVAGDLKRWIKAGRVKQVSIYGVASLQEEKGETQVVDFDLMSIDWTPLDRNGMPTKIVAVGEIDSIIYGGVKKLNLQELLAELKKLGVNPKVVFGEMGWRFEDVAGEVAGEMWAGLQAAVKAIGEMAGLFGLKDAKTEDVIRVIKDLKGASETSTKTIGEIAQLFGLDKDTKTDDLITAAKAAREMQLKAVKEEHDKLVDRVIGEMVVAEAARPLVKMMLKIDDGADEAAIKKAVGEMLARDDVKKSLAGVFKQDVIRPQQPNQNQLSNTGIAVRRVAI